MKKILKKLQIGVLGWAGVEEYPKGGPTKNELRIAEEVGAMLAKAGATVVTGGKGGVMKSAARGAKGSNGLTVGVITGPRRTSNKYIDVEVISGSKIAGLDEVLIPIMCDALIVIGGGAGTLQEISVAYRNKVPVVIISKTFGWAKKMLKEQYLDSRKTIKIIEAKDAKQAVKKAINMCKIK